MSETPPHSLAHGASPECCEKTDTVSILIPLASDATPVHSHIAHTGYGTQQLLLMTSRVLVMSPDGYTTQVRVLLDSTSSASFISEHLAQHMHLPHQHRQAQITDVGGFTHRCLGQSVVHFILVPLSSIQKVF